MPQARKEQAVPVFGREKNRTSVRASEGQPEKSANEQFLRQRPDVRNSRPFIQIGGDNGASCIDVRGNALVPGETTFTEEPQPMTTNLNGFGCAFPAPLLRANASFGGQIEIGPWQQGFSPIPFIQSRMMEDGSCQEKNWASWFSQ